MLEVNITGRLIALLKDFTTSLATRSESFTPIKKKYLPLEC